MKTEKVELNIDSSLLKQGEDLFEDLGLSLESAITVFIKQSVREQGLPFKPTRNAADVGAKAGNIVESTAIEKPKKIGNLTHAEKPSMIDLDSLR